MKKIYFLVIIVFISICSTFVSAEENSTNNFIDFISSPNMTVPLIIILAIVILAIIFSLIKKENLKDDKVLTDYIKEEKEKKKKLKNDSEKKDPINLKKHVFQQNNIKKGKFQQKIVNYITQAFKLGLDDKKIKSNLLNAGWKKEDIKKTFEEINNL